VSGLGTVLAALARDLDDAGAPWAVVGGLAVSVRATPRFTSDVDVAVAVADDAGAEAVVRALLGAGYRLEAIVEQQALGRLATVRLRPPGASSFLVDLLFATSGVEGRVVGAATFEQVLGQQLPVATVGHLVVMKLLSVGPGRAKDQVDLDALALCLDAEEVARARAAAADLTARGFQRGRDLVGALEAWLAAQAP
jgi:hypothetical protein